MYNEASKIQRIYMAIIAILAGLYLITCAPTAAMQTVKICLDQVMFRLIPLDHDFYPAVPILSATFSVSIILIVFAGALSLIIAKSLYDGKEWARPTALGLFAIPSVAGMTMIIPWLVLVLAEYPDKGAPSPTISGMAPAAHVMLLGLFFYYSILLADKDTLKNKLLKLIPYTLLGVVAGMVFMNGQHGVRYFIFLKDFPNEALLTPLRHFITNLDHLDPVTFKQTSDAAVYSPHTLALLLGGYLNYVSTAMIMLAIPFMAMRKKIGWYMAATASLATAAVSYQGFLVRNSHEWLQGGFLSTALLIVLLIPVFRRMFFPEEK